MANWQPRCAYCGCFVKYSKADRFTPFGGSQDIDPPEEEFICKRCTRQQYQESIRERRLPGHWCPAQWEYKAAKRLGFVRAGPPGAAWSHWFASNAIPEGYQVCL